MLYIESIDTNTVRFGEAAGGGTHFKDHPKALEIRQDEIERMWIWNTENNEAVLNCADISKINLGGTVYTDPALFVAAFYTLITT